MFQGIIPRLISVGLFLTMALLGGLQNAHAQAEPCSNPDGFYLYCEGDCPPELTQQGECTTRLEQPDKKYCCCPDNFVPDDAGSETTPGGPPGSIGECPGGGTDDCDEDKDECPPPPPWAASAAVEKTSDPTFTDNVLDLVRDNVLLKTKRGKQYVELVYKFSSDVDRLLVTNPSLVTDTAALLNENLPLLLNLANGQNITVSTRKLEQALELLEKYSNAARPHGELERAITKAITGLKDKQFLRKLGIRVINETR